MKVGLVADTFSIEEGTGIARYSRELFTGLSGLGLDVQPLCSSPPSVPLGAQVNHVLKMPYMVSRRANEFDIVHAIGPAFAFCFPFIDRVKTVITYHDLITLLCEHTSNAFHARLLAPLILRIGRFADQIIADSTQTRDEVVAHLGISQERITVVNLGVDRRFAPIKKETRDGYVIGYIGALDRRKRLDYLLRAFRLLRERYEELSVRLVICGSKHSEYPNLVKLAAELNLNDYVEFRGFVAEDVLTETYNAFDVFILPSEWEGFGLPILEAQRCGVPVIIREGVHIPAEVARCCLRAKSEEDMAGKIYQLLTDSSLRSMLIQEGLKHSSQFTWERTARKTLAVYERLYCCEG